MLTHYHHLRITFKVCLATNSPLQRALWTTELPVGSLLKLFTCCIGTLRIGHNSKQVITSIKDMLDQVKVHSISKVISCVQRVRKCERSSWQADFKCTNSDSTATPGIMCGKGSSVHYKPWSDICPIMAGGFIHDGAGGRYFPCQFISLGHYDCGGNEK